jgi:hypothetical protein
VGDRALQKIARRYEIRVKDGEVPAPRHGQAPFQCAGLEALAILAMDQLDIKALCSQRGNARLRQPGRFISRVIQHLDLQAVTRVVKASHRVDEPGHHVHLVEKRKLHRHRRPGLWVRRLDRALRPVTPIQDSQQQRVGSIDSHRQGRSQIDDTQK